MSTAASERARQAVERATKILAHAADVIAPDGCEVRILAQTPRGSMAHFTLGPGQVARAVAHRTVEEVWYFLAGQGRMWRRHADEETIVEVLPGLSLAIPLGTHFQLRNDGAEPVAAVAVTMPPWPGQNEAYVVEGKWPSTVGD
jgi:mannose-6-phosphate isomerase-like protein (cupin superfamily)